MSVHLTHPAHLTGAAPATWAIHTTAGHPFRVFGHDWPDRQAAEHMAQHLEQVLGIPLTVGRWHPVRSLADLPEWQEVHVIRVTDHALAHRAGRGGTAVCGARVLGSPITAGRLLMHHFGGLCGVCWPGWCE